MFEKCRRKNAATSSITALFPSYVNISCWFLEFLLFLIMNKRLLSSIIYYNFSTITITFLTSFLVLSLKKATSFSSDSFPFILILLRTSLLPTFISVSKRPYFPELSFFTDTFTVTAFPYLFFSRLFWTLSVNTAAKTSGSFPSILLYFSLLTSVDFVAMSEIHWMVQLLHLLYRLHPLLSHLVLCILPVSLLLSVFPHNQQFLYP